MPRKLRVEYPGAMYHVMSRGDRGENIYLDDVDRQDFLKTLAEGMPEGWLAGSCVLLDTCRVECILHAFGTKAGCFV